jgi:hypothetical protein
MTSMPFNLDPNATRDPANPIDTPEGTADLNVGAGPDSGDEASDDVEQSIISADAIRHATEGSDDR